MNESTWYSITITAQLPQTVAELSQYVSEMRYATSLKQIHGTQMILLPVKFPHNYPHK